MDKNELIEAMTKLAEAMNAQASGYTFTANMHLSKGDMSEADPHLFAANAWNAASKGILDVLARAI
jgi:hypothetical protein